MKSIADLEKIREAALERVNLRSDRQGIRIVVGMATCGIAAGARPVMMSFLDEIKKRGIEHVVVTQTGCIGACQYEPIVEVYDGDEKTTYIEMTVDKAKRVVLEHIVNGNIVDGYTIGSYKK
ncbi:MAG: (2Fe-2S) ferredoxin domain-containing protein [Clostridiales bacterium]|nr:(2Fe-2S) ferredoxin domain-containing protein [Clostridiales bacterium]